MRPLLGLCGAAWLLLGSGSGLLFGQTTLEFDHARQQARLITVQRGVEKTTALRPGAKVILGASDTVRLRVGLLAFAEGVGWPGAFCRALFHSVRRRVYRGPGR